MFVTGVQTCALPIYVPGGVEDRLEELGDERMAQKRAGDRVLRARAEGDLRADGTEVHLLHEEVETRRLEGRNGVAAT